MPLVHLREPNSGSFYLCIKPSRCGLMMMWCLCVFGCRLDRGSWETVWVRTVQLRAQS